MPGYYDFNSILSQRLSEIRQYINTRPLVLGGIATSGGGSQGRPTGYIGTLAQTRVSYDKTEAALSGTYFGSPSLLDNLNHIRYRLEALEAASGVSPGSFTVKEGGVVVASGITVLDFLGSVTVNESPTGEANITVVASGGSVALDGSYDYITLSGSTITRHQVDLTTDVTGELPDANVANNITLTDITQITNRSHTDLSDIGSNTHAQIDAHIALSGIHFEQGDISIPAAQISDFDTEVSNNTDVAANTSARHSAVTVQDTETVDLTLAGQDVQARVIFSGVNHDQLLGYDVDEHFTQAEISIPASQVSDFDTEVSNNTDVSANTSARHSAVTVLDTGTVDLSLTGQEISAVVKVSGVDHDGLLNTHNLTTDIDHTNIQNIGTNTHAQIDTHIANTAIHFNKSSIVASGVAYDNTDSSLIATDVQEAIDELKEYVTPVTYSGVSLNLAVGTYLSGDIDSLATIDDADSYSLQETTGSPAYDLQVTFSGVVDFNKVLSHHQYDGLITHEVYMQLYNTISTDWDSIHTIESNSLSYDFASIDVSNYSNYIDTGGVVILRYVHTTPGNTSHTFDLDYAALQHSLAGGGVTEHGGLSGLGDDDHTQYILADGSRAMTGALDVGGNQITNVGNVDGVDISTHAADTSIHFDELEELSNVIGVPASGQYLKFLGTNWTPATVSGVGGVTNLSELSDVNVAGVTDGQSLTYDVGTSKWIPVTISGTGSGITNIDGGFANDVYTGTGLSPIDGGGA